MTEYFEKHLGSEYDFILEDDGVYIYKKSTNVCVVVGWINWYPEIQFRSKCIILRRIDKVENILQPILKKYNITQAHYNDFVGTIHEFLDLSKYDDFSKKINIENETGGIVKKLFELIKSRIDPIENASISSIFLKTENMPMEEMVDYINQPLALRRMIFKFLAKSSDFEEFSENYISSAEKKAKQKDSFRNFDKASRELYEVLKQMDAESTSQRI